MPIGETMAAPVTTTRWKSGAEESMCGQAKEDRELRLVRKLAGS
jgi:hypothetical protein